MSEIKVLIVEDEVLIAEDIRESLTNIDYAVEAVAYNKTEALEALTVTEPDIALLDINLGNNMDGFEIAEQINAKHQFPFLFLTSYSTKSIIDQAKLLRPMGYIMKPFTEADLYTNIEIALFNYAQRNKPNHFSRDLINKKLLTEITEKEFEVLQDLYEGSTNKQMAEKHFVSVNTIKTHIKKLYDKLDTHSRSETIARLRSMLAQ